MRSIFDNRVNFVLSTVLAVLFVAFLIVMLFSGGTPVGDSGSVSYDNIISTENPYATESTDSTESTEASTTEPASTTVNVMETTVPVTTTQPVATQPATQMITRPVAQQNSNLLTNTNSNSNANAYTQYTHTNTVPTNNSQNNYSNYNSNNNNSNSSGTNTTVTQKQETTNSNNSATTPTSPSSNNSDHKEVNNVTNNNYNTNNITNNNNYYYNYYYSNDGDTNNPNYNNQWGKGYLVAIDNPDQNYNCGNVTLTEEDRDLLQRLCAGAFGEDFIGSTLIAQAVKNAMYFDGYMSVQSVIEDYYYIFSTDVEPNRVSRMAVEFIFDNNYSSVQHNIFYACPKDVNEVALFRDCDQVVEYRGVIFFDKKQQMFNEGF